MSPQQTHNLSTSQHPASIDEWKSTSFIATIPEKVQSACKTLEKDGSNYDEWELRIVSFIETITGLRGYFDGDDTVTTDQHGDRIIRNMIENSIPTEIARKVTKSDSAKSTIAAIKSLFLVPSRRKQLGLWQELIQLKHEDQEDIKNYLCKIDNTFSDLDQAGFSWSRDSLMALVYEHGLSSRFKNVSTNLDARLRSQPSNPISAKEVKDAIRAEQLSQNNISDLSNFSRLRLTSGLGVPPSSSSDHGGSLVSKHGCFTPSVTSSSNAPQTQQFRAEPSSCDNPACPIHGKIQACSTSRLPLCLELVDMYGQLFTAEEEILGEVRGSEGTITEVWDEYEASQSQKGGNRA